MLYPGTVGAIVTVVFTPTAEHGADFDRLLEELSRYLQANPPEGMDSMTVLRTDTRAVLVQASWREVAAQRAFRSSPGGASLFRRLSECCDSAPITYYGSVDPSVSFSGGKTAREPRRGD